MKRELIALLLMLAILLQGSFSALAAASPVMSSDCQTTAAAHADASQDSCCPKGPHAMNCCLDLCSLSVAATTSSVVVALLPLAATVEAARTPTFFSRGDAPLIRPPIS